MARSMVEEGGRFIGLVLRIRGARIGRVNASFAKVFMSRRIDALRRWERDVPCSKDVEESLFVYDWEGGMNMCEV